MPAVSAARGLRAQLTALIVQYLSDPPAWPIRVTIADRSGQAHRLILREPAHSDSRTHLTPTMADALEAAGEETWLGSVELSHAAGWDYNAHWRRQVAKLVMVGYLEREPRSKKLRRTPAGTARDRARREEEAGQE